MAFSSSVQAWFLAFTCNALIVLHFDWFPPGSGFYFGNQRSLYTANTLNSLILCTSMLLTMVHLVVVPIRFRSKRSLRLPGKMMLFLPKLGTCTSRSSPWLIVLGMLLILPRYLLPYIAIVVLISWYGSSFLPTYCSYLLDRVS